MHFRIGVFFVCLLSLIRRRILSKIARGFPPTKWRFQVSLGTSCMLMWKLGKCYSWPGNIQNTQNGKYTNEEPSNYGGRPYLIYFVFLRCFNNSWGKPIFMFAEVCWRALRRAILFVLFAGLAALPCLDLLPAVRGDCPCFRLLFFHWWNEPTVKSYWRALISWQPTWLECKSLARRPPSRATFSSSGTWKGRSWGEGVRRQTNCHFRGWGWGWGVGFDPFLLLSSSTSNFTDLPLPGSRGGNKERRKHLIRVLVATAEWQ